MKKSIKIKSILVVALAIMCIIGAGTAYAATYNTTNWYNGYTTTGSVTLVSNINDNNTHTWYAGEYNDLTAGYVEVTALYWDGSAYDNYRTIGNLYDEYYQDFPYSGSQSTGKLQFRNRYHTGTWMYNYGVFT